MSGLKSGLLVGYARVSSSDQAEHSQVDALRSGGVSRIVVERVSGVAERPLLDELIGSLAQGDTLVVTEVSRLGRSTSDVLLLVDDLQLRGVHLRILNLGIDTGTPAGGLVVTMMAGLARFERELLRERQRRGIEAARQRGKHLGRPRVLTAEHAQKAIERLWNNDTLAMLAAEWRVSERTISRLVSKHVGGGESPLRPGGRGKPKHRGRIKSLE